MRLFVALDINDAIRGRIARFVEGLCEFAPEARWVRPESLHLTLKFIGEKLESGQEQILLALGNVYQRAVEIQFRGYGFFPTAKAPRVFWIGTQPSAELGALAAAVDAALVTIGVAKEEHVFSPHLTLARRAGGSGFPRWSEGDIPNHAFKKLQEKLGRLPEMEFGAMTCSEFYLYQSQLSPKGSKYTKLAAFRLH